MVCKTEERNTALQQSTQYNLISYMLLLKYGKNLLN